MGFLEIYGNKIVVDIRKFTKSHTLYYLFGGILLFFSNFVAQVV